MQVLPQTIDSPLTPQLSPSSPRYNSLHTISATPIYSTLPKIDARRAIDLGSREDLLDLQDDSDGNSPVSVTSFEKDKPDAVKIRQGDESAEEGSLEAEVGSAMIGGARKRSLVGSVFFENMDHDVTLSELQYFLEPIVTVKPPTPSPPKRRGSMKNRFRPLLQSPSQRHSIALSSSPENVNFLQRIISPNSVFASAPLRQIHSNSVPPTVPPTIETVPPSPVRPAMGSRASTNPETVPTVASTRRREPPSPRSISVRKSSLNVAPVVGSLGAAALGSSSRSSPVTTKAGLLAVPEMTPPKRRGMVGDDRRGGDIEMLGVSAGSPGSPKPKRPLSGLFRRTSSSKSSGSGKESQGTQPIRTAVVVTAPTPQKDRTVIRRAESPSPKSRNPSTTIVAAGRRSSSFEETTRPIIFEASERSPSTSSSNGGGWKSLFRKKKNPTKGNESNESGTESFHVVGRRRASTFSSIGESSSSASTSGATNTDVEYLDSGNFTNPMISMSAIEGNYILNRIEEDSSAVSRSGTVNTVTSTTTVVPRPQASHFLHAKGPSIDRRRSAPGVAWPSGVEVMTVPADEDLEYLGRRRARSWGSWPDGGQWDSYPTRPMLPFAFPWEGDAQETYREELSDRQ